MGLAELSVWEWVKRMMMGMGDRDKKQLLGIWRQLGGDERRSLIHFAEFLASRLPQVNAPVESVPVTPLTILRPEVESAVAGLKRLKKTYPMIEADESVLSEASRILMGKVMGVGDAEVIDQLESFFAQRYRLWQENQ